MTQLTEEQSKRLKQIRERQDQRREWAYGQDIDFLLSLHESDSQAAGTLLSDDDLVTEMNKVSENLVREWYCESQHRDELVDEIAVTLGAAHRRAEANAATLMRDKCVEKVRNTAKAHREFAEKLKGKAKAMSELQTIRAEECEGLAEVLSSLTLDPLEPEK